MIQVIHKNTTHGQSSGENQTSEYRSWIRMKERCGNKKNNRYSSYGGRGIKVCDRWIDSFENFFMDMGNKPFKSYSIDRIDNDGNYEPGNCRWATRKEQCVNRRSNVYLEFYGTKKTVSQWGECLNISERTLHSRLSDGWSIQKILITPIRSWNRYRKRQDGKLTFHEIANKAGCSYSTAYRHINGEKSIKFGICIDKIMMR